MIGGGLHLVEQVTRQQHRAAMVGEVAEERSHPGDALGIEPVRRFIEDQAPPVHTARALLAEADDHTAHADHFISEADRVDARSARTESSKSEDR